MKRTFLPRIQTLIVIVNLIVLTLPIFGIAALRLYESELIRQTESNLIGQAAWISALFRDQVIRGIEKERKANKKQKHVEYGHQVEQQFKRDEGVFYNPILPTLDLVSDSVFPPTKRAEVPDMSPDVLAKKAGRRIRPIIQQAKRVTLCSIRVLDQNGIVVASSGNELGMSLIAREEVNRALKGEFVSLLRKRKSKEPAAFKFVKRGNRVRVTVAFPVVENNRVYGVVLLSRTALDIAKALYLIRDHLVYVCLVLFMIVLAVSLLTTLAISRPVKALREQAKRVKSGKANSLLPLSHPGTQEVAELSHSLIEMADTLKKRSEYITSFANSVSHEFKTPIASLTGTVELLNDHYRTMTELERSRFLEMLTKDIVRLDLLVRRMHELAYADVVRYGDESSNVKEVIQDLSNRYLDKQVEFEIHLPDKMLPAKISEEHLDSILSNLIENSLNHGGNVSQIKLQVNAIRKKNKQQLEIIIKDNGQGISAENAKKIFQPFFTTARDTGGTGLGLSIVKSLVKSHAGDIELLEQQHGTCFKITLPSKRFSSKRI